MRRDQFAITLVCLTLAAFLGGIAGDWLLRGGLAVAQPVEEEEEVDFQVKARAFILVDAEGGTQAVLDTGEGGEPSLRMFGRQEGNRLELSAAAAGPSLRLQAPGAREVVLGTSGLTRLPAARSIPSRER